MQRYSQETNHGEPWAEPDDAGCWVQHSDALKAIAAAVAAERERLMCGDYFTHDRTGVRFVCRAVTRHDYGGSMPILRAEIELAPK